MQQIAQWYTFDTATNAPDVFKPWFVARAASIAAITLRPDRYAEIENLERVAEQAAVDAYLQTAWTTGPGMATPTLLNIRKYVMSYCARAMSETTSTSGTRARPRLWINPAIIDQAAMRVFNKVWNHADWPFRKRPVTLVITRVDFSGASWDESTRTLTATGAFGQVAPGSMLRVSSGTNVNTGDYMVLSATANTVTLASSIQAYGAAASAVAGAVAVPVLRGLPAGETFDSAQVTRWVLDDGVTTMEWAGPDVYGTVTARFGTSEGIPEWYRIVERNDIRHWYFAPFPDTTYTMFGEVCVSGPGTPSSVTDTGVYQKFPAEFYPYFFRATLAEVLTGLGHGRGQAAARDAEVEMERLLANYADQGAAMSGRPLRDVYGDFYMLRSRTDDMTLGGEI